MFCGENKEEFIIEKNDGNITYFYDKRSERIGEIKIFLQSEIFKNIKKSIKKPTFLSLGGDGLFVYVAKKAHKEHTSILGVNFGTKGFLVQEKDIFEKEKLEFIIKKYPILKVKIQMKNREELVGFAFNEVYITRTGNASSLELKISHLGKTVKNYRGDGLMISTPAGSTGWSKSYSGIILPHNANLNILTPVGNIFPENFKSMVLSDKGRIYIKHLSKRVNAVDILLDNTRILCYEEDPFDIVIERDEKLIDVLIEKSNLKHFNTKVYMEQGMEL